MKDTKKLVRVLREACLQQRAQPLGMPKCEFHSKEKVAEGGRSKGEAEVRGRTKENFRQGFGNHC